MSDEPYIAINMANLKYGISNNEAKLALGSGFNAN